VETKNNGRRTVVSGRTLQVNGRNATISLNGPSSGLKISSISTIGKEELTSAEAQRANIILKALQQTLPILKNPFVRRIWLPSEPTTWPRPLSPPLEYLWFPGCDLNSSQLDAVDAVLSDDDADRTVVIHGPPGTGKTSVIAAVVTSTSMMSPRPLWLVAQSNVAVKNIAEKLVSVGFLQFKILVSKDFHFDWYYITL
jgi:AAA domain